MTRGVIIFFEGDKMYASSEFNGDMGPEQICGEEVLKKLPKIKTSTQFIKYIKSWYYDPEFEEEVHVYKAEPDYKKWKQWKWTDYLYVKNFPGTKGIKIFNYGEPIK